MERCVCESVTRDVSLLVVHLTFLPNTPKILCTMWFYVSFPIALITCYFTLVHCLQTHNGEAGSS